MNERTEKLRCPIVHHRIRSIPREGFSFLPYRFLRDGFLEQLNRDELALYIFLLLAGNRHGVSFYRFDIICSQLQLTLNAYIQARNGLIAKDLIATDGRRFQVLSLPEHPPPPSTAKILSQQADLEEQDPATIRATILAELGLDAED